MTGLRTNSIVIRGDTFTVSEMTAKTMRQARKLLESDKTQFELFVANAGMVDPKWSIAELEGKASIYSEAIAAEAIRLTKEDDKPEKND